MRSVQWVDRKREFTRTHTAGLLRTGSEPSSAVEVAKPAAVAKSGGGQSEQEGQLDFGEFEQLMTDGAILERLLLGSRVKAGGSDSAAQGGDAQIHKDLALLDELLLSERAEKLRAAGLLGRLKDATMEDLETVGIEGAAAHQLLKVASLTVVGSQAILLLLVISRSILRDSL